MKYIQTLYFDKSVNPLKHGFGWAAPEYHLMSWALSSLQLNRIYKTSSLYANSDAARLLIDVLKLPYEFVHVTHDKLVLPNEQLWALPKILTYSLQNDPFLHLDGDVFLFDKLPASLLGAELIAQNMEEATEYYTSTQMQLKENFSYFPSCVKPDFENNIPIKAVNAGILGGKNIEFIKEYSHLAFKYINKNAHNLSKINVDRFNVFFEQHLFYSLAKKNGIPVQFYFPDIVNDNQYQHLGEFHETPCTKSYLHLLGHYKRDEYTCMQMAAKLRELYPDYYYRIMELFRDKGMKYPFGKFYFNNVNSESGFREYNKCVIEKYMEERYVASGIREGVDFNFNDIPSLKILNDFVEHLVSDNTLDIDPVHLQQDFQVFAEKVINKLNAPEYSPEYLYGRDLHSQGWHCSLFGETKLIESVKIVKAKESFIIETEFDWAGIVNMHQRVGVVYYDHLKIIAGQYNNLVIPEASEHKVSLYDLDEMEKIILSLVNEPITIGSVFKEMENYIEEDVILNHYAEYTDLILTFIKSLVVKKAIVPYN